VDRLVPFVQKNLEQKCGVYVITAYLLSQYSYSFVWVPVLSNFQHLTSPKEETVLQLMACI